jgi:hypothetical protein
VQHPADFGFHFVSLPFLGRICIEVQGFVRAPGVSSLDAPIQARQCWLTARTIPAPPRLQVACYIPQLLPTDRSLASESDLVRVSGSRPDMYTTDLPCQIAPVQYFYNVPWSNPGRAPVNPRGLINKQQACCRGRSNIGRSNTAE